MTFQESLHYFKICTVKRNNNIYCSLLIACIYFFLIAIPFVFTGKKDETFNDIRITMRGFVLLLLVGTADEAKRNVQKL